jgi:hypothetical protein
MSAKKYIFIIILLNIFGVILAQENPDNSSDNRQIIVKYQGSNQSFLMEIKVELISVPFEGYTNYDELNRYDTARYGCLQKRYFRNLYTNEIQSQIWQISYMNDPYHFVYPSNHILCSHTSAYPNWFNSETISFLCGFAKYKFTATIPATGEVYQWYFDYTDSKYGKFHFFGQDNHYISRWMFLYNDNNQLNQKMELWKSDESNNLIEFKRYITTGQFPEFTIWELTTNGNQTTPFETNFYIRGTPFPLRWGVARDSIHQISLFTTAIIDTVLPYDDSRITSNVNTDADYYNDLTIPVNERPNTTVTPGAYIVENPNEGLIFNIENSADLIIDTNKKFGISNYDSLHCKPGSKITIKKDGKLFATNIYHAPDNIQGFGIISLEDCAVEGESNSKIEIPANGDLHIIGEVNLENVILDLKTGSNLYLHPDSKLIVDGINAKLIINNNVNIWIGNNASITVKNGAVCSIEGSTFSSTGEWKGISLENAGVQSYIMNCTINNSKNPIKILNNYTSAFYTKIIKNNVINLATSGTEAVYCENIFNLLFDNNTINLGSNSGLGLRIKNNYNAGPPGDGGEEYYNLNIINNTFNGGSVPLALVCYASGYTPYFIKNNTFNSNNSNTSLFGRLMGGKIELNNFNLVNLSGKAVQIEQSNIDALLNNFRSTNATIQLQSATIRLSPVLNGDNWIWSGGNNKLYSSASDNIQFNTSFAHLDYGQNCFTRESGSSYHLAGTLNIGNENIYYLRNNDFNNSNIPDVSLGDVTVSWYGSDFGCINSTDYGNVWTIQDMGFGVYDTIYTTINNSGSQTPSDQQLYSTAYLHKVNHDYFDAINNYKSLINNYPDSYYTNSCLYEFYECYMELDTSNEQSYRDILYGNLKTFLDSKILSGLYDEEFNDAAYNISLMCLSNMSEYNEAMEGYEFISLFHPDPTIRLLASWDFAEIELLINGSGAQPNTAFEKGDDTFRDKLQSRIERNIKGDPVMGKMKDNYDKMKIKSELEFSQKLKKENVSNNEISRIKKACKTEDDNIRNKVINNLRNLKNLTKEEYLHRQREDILYIVNKDNNIRIQSGDNNLPLKYELSQNYPNPFNPVTTIQFQVPSLKFVKLVVYDVLGREVRTLVNEYKQAGSYIVSFDGSDFASGVYFYRIESGDFVQVKRMILLK